MESRSTPDKILVFTDKHAAVIIDWAFIIVALFVFWILSRPLFARQPHEGFTIALLTSNIALPLLRGLAGKKYKRLGGYLHGTAILTIVVVFRLLYL